jgi:hypothetical protein
LLLRCLIRPNLLVDGDCQGIYPWVSTLVMGNLMGRRFWVGRGFFFLGGGKRNSRVRNVETFSQDDASSKQTCVYVTCYMLSSGGFTAACLHSITKGVLDPRLPWADTCAVQASTTRRPSPHIEDGEGVCYM